MSGFTLKAVAGRIQKIDSTINWKLYTALATLARLSGHKKSVVETAVFGQDKPSKDFGNAWSRGGRVFGTLLSGDKDKQAELRVMGIDEAETEMIRIIDAHMTALGVKGKNAYDAVIDYLSKEDIPAAPEPEAEEPAPAQAAEAAPPVAVSDQGEPMSEDEVIAALTPYLDNMSDAGLNKVAEYVTGLMLARQAAALPKAA